MLKFCYFYFILKLVGIYNIGCCYVRYKCDLAGYTVFIAGMEIHVIEKDSFVVVDFVIC